MTGETFRHGGYVSIYPSAANGGCWRVEHMTHSGGSAAVLGEYFYLAEAEAAAVACAVERGAEFDHGGPAGVEAAR